MSNKYRTEQNTEATSKGYSTAHTPKQSIKGGNKYKYKKSNTNSTMHLNDKQKSSKEKWYSRNIKTSSLRMRTQLTIQDRLYSEFKASVLREAQKYGNDKVKIKAKLNLVKNMLYQ